MSLSKCFCRVSSRQISLLFPSGRQPENYQPYEDSLTANELTRLVNKFLDNLPQENRVIFIRRYWYADSVGDISRRMKLSENNVSVRLLRIREKLQKYLMKEGYKL